MVSPSLVEIHLSPCTALLSHVPPQVVSFLLSPEARELRPLLVDQLATAGDLFLRDRARRLFNGELGHITHSAGRTAALAAKTFMQSCMCVSS